MGKRLSLSTLGKSLPYDRNKITPGILHLGIGAFHRAHPDVRHDLAHPDVSMSAPGLLMRALELRRKAGIAPFTVLCCDNLPANGETVATVVTDYAKLRSFELADFITREVTFPSTMVDRIVPATTDEDRRLLLEATGFERVGVQLVANVKPFEHMKLRMLNGSHSTLAYLGYLAAMNMSARQLQTLHFSNLFMA